MLVSKALRVLVTAHCALRRNLGKLICATVGMPVLLMRGAVHAMRDVESARAAYVATLRAEQEKSTLPRHVEDGLFLLHMQHYYARTGIGARGHAFARFFGSKRVCRAVDTLEDVYAVSLLVPLGATLGMSLPF